MENNTSTFEGQIDSLLYVYSLADQLKVSYVPVFKFVW